MFTIIISEYKHMRPKTIPCQLSPGRANSIYCFRSIGIIHDGQYSQLDKLIMHVMAAPV